MKEELQTVLAELIQKTLQGAEATKDFLTAEIPDVVYQLLMWHGVYNFILFIVGVVILLVLICANYKQYKYWKKITPDQIKKLPRDLQSYNSDRIDWCLLGLYNIFQLVVIVPVMFLINLTWLQIWVAPKVWLIEYMGQLIK